MNIQRMRAAAGVGMLLGAGLLMVPSAWAAPIQPYVLASTADGAMATQVEAVKGKLTAAGFEIIGEFSPYAGAQVIAVTSPELLQAAAGDARGGFAAAEHVALTESDGKVQISYLNPAYVAAAYRISADLSGVSAKLKEALGQAGTFGTEKGREPDDLRSFNYMLGMEHFDDFYKLGSHASYEEAVKAVEDNLAKQVGGAAKVYRIDIPGKQQTVFGISRASVKDQAANDQHIMMDVVDKNFDIKTTAYLPYQLMVDGKDVVALHMRFRMAVWHPDLTMVTFGKLMSSPGAIEELLRKVAGGGKDKGFNF
ncbi:hypothetical protein E4T66_00855 [Sinimarinibacterium sp. CAU 1509]|uniref:hypothetical protein n=1 Tax=Sinimarinibacterium sp. CAU 1509 TaxID=2562283 RepID=UPI0010AC1578|nr:hypothetical protein [Sinimarinibacterium sp. CAU 1509]TJY64823.1 hypothetical protein E4T66_00855 [Sinimarinibacterium sp. CAU 1509]